MAGGSPAPGPQIGAGPWPVSNHTPLQEVNGRRGGEASSVLTAARQW